MAAEAGAVKTEYKPRTFRICWITDIQIRSKSFGSGRLTKAQHSLLETLMGEHGASYIHDELRDVKLSLTERGFKKYYKIAHLRPLPVDFNYEKDEKGNTIIRLRCTERQLNYFFFKLGSDVKILEPLDIAKKFKQDYLRAYQQYEDI